MEVEYQGRGLVGCRAYIFTVSGVLVLFLCLLILWSLVLPDFFFHFVYLIILLLLLLLFLLSLSQGSSKTASLPSQGMGKVCVHSSLSKPTLLDYTGYVVVDACVSRSNPFQIDVHFWDQSILLHRKGSSVHKYIQQNLSMIFTIMYPIWIYDEHCFRTNSRAIIDPNEHHPHTIRILFLIKNLSWGIYIDMK